MALPIFTRGLAASLVGRVDVVLGNEEDFSVMLGITLHGVSDAFDELTVARAVPLPPRMS